MEFVVTVISDDTASLKAMDTWQNITKIAGQGDSPSVILTMGFPYSNFTFSSISHNYLSQE